MLNLYILDHTLCHMMWVSTRLYYIHTFSDVRTQCLIQVKHKTYTAWPTSMTPHQPDLSLIHSRVVCYLYRIITIVILPYHPTSPGQHHISLTSSLSLSPSSYVYSTLVFCSTMEWGTKVKVKMKLDLDLNLVTWREM